MAENRTRTSRVSGKVLRTLRIEKGHSREGLAARSGVAKRVIDAIEGGTHACFHKTIEALAQTLAVPAEALLHHTRVELSQVVPTGEVLGRDREIAMIESAWRRNVGTLLTVTACGGAGKSTLLAHWLRRLRERGYDNAERIFWWALGSSEVNGQAMCDQFLERALEFFDDDEPRRGTSLERVTRLARRIASQRTILVIDELESIASPFHGGITSVALRALLSQLRGTIDGLCAVIARPPLYLPFGDDGEGGNGREVVVVDLPPLAPDSGGVLLARLGARGTPEDFAATVHEYDGNPLALRLLGTYVAEILRGDISRRESVRLLDAQISAMSATNVIASYIRYFGEHDGLLRDIIGIASLSDQPTPRSILELFRRHEVIPGVSESLALAETEAIGAALGALARMGLLNQIGEARLQLHPIVRVAVRERLISSEPRGAARAHALLSLHFELQVDGAPRSSDEYRALHAAVRHRCLAGEYMAAWRDLYYSRLQRGDMLYSIFSDGLHGEDVATLRLFFRVPWRECHPGTPVAADLMIKYLSGLALQALSRIGDATVAFTSARAVALQVGDFHYAGMLSGHIIHMLALGGELRSAEQEINRSLEICRRSGIRRLMRMIRFKAAHTLWEMGRAQRAAALFEEGMSLAEGEEAPAEQAFLRLLDAMSWFFFFEYLCDSKQSDSALAISSRIASICGAIDLEFSRALVSLTRAMLRGSDAMPNVDRAVLGFRSDCFKELLVGALLLRGDMLLSDGDFVRANLDISEAHMISVASGLRSRECDALALLAKLQGTRGVAEPTLRTALESARQSCGYFVHRLACVD